MEKIYLPRADQFDLMNENLAKIANALALDIDLSTWAGIQKAVRVGVAPDLIPVGTQLAVDHSVYGTHLYDVVAHDYFKSAHDKNAHTMTLMCHNIIASMQFDGQEAFYYAESELPAGTYNFIIKETHSYWKAGTYQFTLTKVLPPNGQLCISGNSDAAMTDRQVVTYADRNSTTTMESVAITSGNGGTSLGTFGVELNHTHRVSNGSNNYKESAIRQFLNSSAEAGSVWTPQTKFDRPPSWMSSLAGFTGGLNEDFLAVIGEVVVHCGANGTYESPDSISVVGKKHIVTDRFYLASQMEIFGNNAESTMDDSVLFPYYENADATDIIKYRDGAVDYWWSRTPRSGGANTSMTVYPDGKSYPYRVYSNAGCVPACTIV